MISGGQSGPPAASTIGTDAHAADVDGSLGRRLVALRPPAGARLHLHSDPDRHVGLHLDVAISPGRRPRAREALRPAAGVHLHIDLHLHLDVGGRSDCQGTTPLGLPGRWNCTFDDEFNGTSLDTTKWVPQETAASGYLNGATACYVDNPDTISVSGGYLNLTARQVAPFTCADGSNSFTTSYEAGMVSTDGPVRPDLRRLRGQRQAPAVRGRRPAGDDVALPADPDLRRRGPTRARSTSPSSTASTRASTCPTSTTPSPRPM